MPPARLIRFQRGDAHAKAIKVSTLRVVTLIGVVVIFVCLVANTGAALYFVANASAQALDNPPLLIAIFSMGLAVAVGWGSLILVIGLFRGGRKRAASAETNH